MSHVYVLTNQHQQFLSKSDEWIDGRDSARLFRSPHKDAAINQMFEANTRDVNLRIELLQCELNSRGQPLVPEEALGDPQPAPILTPEGGPEENPEDSPEKTPEETPVENPAEVPPEQAPEVQPQPAPEVEPQEAPEVTPEQAPEIQPPQPDETSDYRADATGVAADVS